MEGNDTLYHDVEMQLLTSLKKATGTKKETLLHQLCNLTAAWRTSREARR